MTDLEGGHYTDKVIEIFLVLSRSDAVVKKAVSAVPVLKRVCFCYFSFIWHISSIIL